MACAQTRGYAVRMSTVFVFGAATGRNFIHQLQLGLLVESLDWDRGICL